MKQLTDQNYSNLLPGKEWFCVILLNCVYYGMPVPVGSNKHINRGNCEEQLPSPTVGWLLVICRPTVDNLSADCQRSVGQLSNNTLPTVDQQIYLDFSEKDNCEEQLPSTDSRPTVCQQLANT